MKRLIRFGAPGLLLGALALCAVLFSSDAALPAAPQAQAPGGKKLVFSFGANSAYDQYGGIVAEFEAEHPEVKIEFAYIPSSTEYRYNRYITDFYSGENSADIIFSDVVWIPEFAARGWILPLDSYFTPQLREKFLESVLEACRYRKTLYAVPCMIDVPVLYYRTDLVEKPPATYAELIRAAGPLARENGIKYGYVCPAQAYECLSCTALEFIWACGGELIFDGHVAVGSPQGVEGLRLLRETVAVNADNRDLYSFTEDDARLAFQMGDAVFMRNWQQNYKMMQNAESSAVRGKFATAPMPAGPGGPQGVGTMGGWHYVINLNTPYPDEAFAFLEFLSSERVQRFNSEAAGYPPVIRACYEDPKLTGAFTDRGDELLLSYERARLRPQTPYYVELSRRLTPILSRVARGTLPAKEAAGEMEQVLKNYFILDTRGEENA